MFLVTGYLTLQGNLTLLLSLPGTPAKRCGLVTIYRLGLP